MKLNKLQDFVKTADKLNPWLTKYHFHISVPQWYIMEMHLENKLFKDWHSSLCRDEAQQPIQSQITTGHSGFTGQFDISVASSVAKKRTDARSLLSFCVKRRHVLQPVWLGSCCCHKNTDPVDESFRVALRVGWLLCIWPWPLTPLWSEQENTQLGGSRRLSSAEEWQHWLFVQTPRTIHGKLF